jgi:hypothetical protein
VRPLWRRVPSRLKPSQIAFDDPSLAVTVPLGGEAATVGELVRRISAATGLEIHTDLRLRALPVWVRGERARAGDLLAALCWSMTGAIRRLGDAYLLTADVEGLGARYGRLAEWAEQARLEQGEQIQKLTERIAKQRPLAYLQPAPADDALALPAEVASRIEEGWATRRDSNGPSVAVADLPPALQKAVRAQAAWWSGGGVAIDPARAFLRMRPRPSS